LMLSLVPVLFLDTPGVQVLAFIVVTLMYVLLQVAYQPWRSPLLNKLDQAVGVLQLVLLVVIGVAFVPSVTDAVGNDNHAGFKSLYEVLIAFSLMTPFLLATLSGGVTLWAMRASRSKKASVLDWLLPCLLPTPPATIELSKALRTTSSSLSGVQLDALTTCVAAMEAYDKLALANAVVVIENVFSIEDLEAGPERTPSYGNGKGFPLRICDKTSPKLLTVTAEAPSGSEGTFAKVMPDGAGDSNVDCQVESFQLVAESEDEPGRVPHTVGA